MKLTKNHLSTKVSISINFSKYFLEYIRMRNIEVKYLENMRDYQFLKVKNSLLELEKDVKELRGRELKDRKEKIKREMGELFPKPIIV